MTHLREKNENGSISVGDKDSSPQGTLWQRGETDCNYLECGDLSPLSFSIRDDRPLSVFLGGEAL
jgi:hypothetical protein